MKFCVGDPVPYDLTREELAEGLGYSLSQFDAYRRAGTHPAIKQREGPGHPRFDGRAVKRWLERGEDGAVPARRFFGAARRRA